MKMDWGLFDSNAGDNRFLREEIVYSNVVRLHFSFSISTDGHEIFKLKTGLLLLWNRRRLCPAFRLGIFSFTNRNGLHPR
jgi:hypothetical protein